MWEKKITGMLNIFMNFTINQRNRQTYGILCTYHVYYSMMKQRFVTKMELLSFVNSSIVIRP